MDGKEEEQYVYRISTAQEWELLQKEGFAYGGDLDKSTGCFHLSKLSQVQSTLQNFFLNFEGDLYLLQIDAKKTGSDYMNQSSDRATLLLLYPIGVRATLLLLLYPIGVRASLLLLLYPIGIKATLLLLLYPIGVSASLLLLLYPIGVRASLLLLLYPIGARAALLLVVPIGARAALLLFALTDSSMFLL